MRVLVALSFVATIGVNGLANALPLFGRETGEVSNQFGTLVSPAGYVFSIWGLIYLGLLAYSIAQFVRPLATDTLPERLALPLLVSSAANSTWLFLWHSLNLWWSVLVMLALLASLIAAYRLARRDRPHPLSRLEGWSVRAPISLYLGWISVATIANISVALTAAKWSGSPLNPTAWSVIVLVVGTVLAVLSLLRESDAVYAGVFVWAYAGIAVATSDGLVQIVASVLAASIAAGIVLTIVRASRHRSSEQPAV